MCRPDLPSGFPFLSDAHKHIVRQHHYEPWNLFDSEKVHFNKHSGCRIRREQYCPRATGDRARTRDARSATMASVSRSTACSALCARCVRPSFIFVTFASGSFGFVHSLFDATAFRQSPPPKKAVAGESDRRQGAGDPGAGDHAPPQRGVMAERRRAQELRGDIVEGEVSGQAHHRPDSAFTIGRGVKRAVDAYDSTARK